MRPPLALSNSRMNSLLCAFQFQQRYLSGPFVEPPSVPAWKGTLGHRFAERYIPELARRNRKSDHDLAVKIALEITEQEPEHIAEAVQFVAEMFYHGFKLNKRGIHFTELTLAVNRLWQPVDVEFDDAGHATNLTEDIIHGRLDNACSLRQGKYAEIWDFKMGEEHVDDEKVKTNQQLQLYAALWFWTHPECANVDVVLWGVKYGQMNRSHYTYDREYCCSEAARRIEESFAKLDQLYAISKQHGPFTWPAQPDVYTTCQYCPVTHLCPRNLSLIPALIERGPVKIPNRKKKVAA